MISDFISFLQTLVADYGIFGLFLAEVIEEIIVPIPSAAVMMSAGFLYLANISLSFASVVKLLVEVALPLALGHTLGSLLVYGLFFILGHAAVDRLGKYVGISWADIQRANMYFNKGYRDEVLFVLARAIPLIPSVVVNAFSGLTRMPLKKYVGLTLIGSFLRATLMGFIGWQAGSVYFKYAEKIDQLEKFVFILLGLGLFSFVVFRLWRKRTVSHQ